MEQITKKKILWVVYDFVQAGGQRYVYEICKSLNKEKYEIDILKINPMGSDKNWTNEFYYEPTIALGCKIIFLADVLIQGKSIPKSFLQRLTGFVSRKLKLNVVLPFSKSVTNINEVALIHSLLANYDHVNFSGLNVYRTLCIHRNIEPVNGIIHILTAQFQDNTDLYLGYNTEYNYNFVSSIPIESLKYELKNIKNYRYTFYPLCFDTIPYNINIKEENSKPFIIAVFTRLTGMKPLDPYFYALKLLMEQQINVELQVYGAGNPEESGFARQVNYLYINNSVKFMGHADSIPETIKKANIDMIWFQSNNKLPAGYAALEISMSGLPQIFWDFADLGNNNPMGEIFPSFTKLTDFVDYSKQLLASCELRKQLGARQREYILQNNSSQNNIHILEKLFDK